MTRVLAVVLVALLTAGCGERAPASPAHVAVEETAARLADIRSGVLDVDVRVTPLTGGAPVGFTLRGPFALDESLPLPVAEFVYTKVAGEQDATATFISTGREAYAQVDGRAHELPEDEVRRLRGGGREALSLDVLRVDRWVRDPRLRPGEAQTERIEAELDVVAALNDLFALGRAAGAHDPRALAPLEGDDAARVARAVRASSVTVVTGADDRLLRELTIHVQLAADRGLPAGLSGVEFAFGLAVDEHNEPVRVEPPDDVRPAERVPRGSGS